MELNLNDAEAQIKRFQLENRAYRDGKKGIYKKPSDEDLHVYNQNYSMGQSAKRQDDFLLSLQGVDAQFNRMFGGRL